MQATSLEDREVEHRGQTAGARHAHRAVPEEQALRFLLADQVSTLDVDATLRLHKFFEIKNSRRAGCIPGCGRIGSIIFLRSDAGPM